MNAPEIIILIEKYINGSATAEEKEELMEWYRTCTPAIVHLRSDDHLAKKKVKKRILFNLLKQL